MKIKDMFSRRKNQYLNLDPSWNMTFPGDEASQRQALSEELRFGVAALTFPGLAFVMPNPDPILKKLGLGRDVEAYTELLADPQLYGAIENNRKPGVTSLLLGLQKDKVEKAEADLIDRYFQYIMESGDYFTALNQALDTPYFGRMTFGLVWGELDGYFVPLKISSIPHEYAKYDNFGEFMVAESGQYFHYPDHPARFITLRNKPTATNPYGEAILSRCFWNIKFKKDALKLWAIRADKYGIPWMWGKYNPGALAKEFNVDPASAGNLLFDRLSAMARAGTIVTPENIIDLQIINGNQGDPKAEILFESLIRICDEQNTKLILGHSGATESTSGDKLSNDTTATDIRNAVVTSDKRYPETLFNRIIQLIHMFNFSGKELPQYQLYAEEDVDMTLAQRDNTLVPFLTLAGEKPSKKYLMKQYGFEDDDLIPWNPSEQAGIPLPKAQKLLPAFKALVEQSFQNATNDVTPDQNAIDGETDNQIQDTKPTDAMLKIITNYLESKGDFKEALNSLSELFPKISTKDLQAKLEQILFTADIIGRISVQDELGVDNGQKDN